jgi:hypothetical protein
MAIVDDLDMIWGWSGSVVGLPKAEALGLVELVSEVLSV